MGWLTFIAVVAIVYGLLLKERLDESDATNKKQFADLENRLTGLERTIGRQLDRVDDNLQRAIGSLSADLQAVDRQLDRLQEAIASLEPDICPEQRASWLGPDPKTPEEMAQSRVRALGWEPSGGLEDAIETAIRETGASSLAQMGLVIKTVRGHLGNSVSDETELSKLVRLRLEGSKWEFPTR